MFCRQTFSLKLQQKLIWATIAIFCCSKIISYVDLAYWGIRKSFLKCWIIIAVDFQYRSFKVGREENDYVMTLGEFVAGDAGMACRGGVLEHVLGLEDTIWSPWPRRSSSWSRSLQVLENALSSAQGQHYFLTCWKWAKVMNNFVSSWRTPASLRKNFQAKFILGERLNFWSEKRRSFFFSGERLNIPENLQSLGLKTFSFLFFF